jgi:molybdopterin converting factor subunit 1
MTVTVLLFASYAESLGMTSMELEMPEGASVDDALARVTSKAAGKLPPRPLVAVNQSYACGHERLRSGDEIAIIPPVAGG